MGELIVAEVLPRDAVPSGPHTDRSDQKRLGIRGSVTFASSHIPSTNGTLLDTSGSLSLATTPASEICSRLVATYDGDLALFSSDDHAARAQSLGFSILPTVHSAPETSATRLRLDVDTL